MPKKTSPPRSEKAKNVKPKQTNPDRVSLTEDEASALIVAMGARGTADRVAAQNVVRGLLGADCVVPGTRIVIVPWFARRHRMGPAAVRRWIDRAWKAGLVRPMLVFGHEAGHAWLARSDRVLCPIAAIDDAKREICVYLELAGAKKRFR